MEVKNMLKKCFEKSAMRSIRDKKSKSLLILLEKEIIKRDKRIKNEAIDDLIYNESCTVYCGPNVLMSACNDREYCGDRNYSVSSSYGKSHYFNSLDRAMKCLTDLNMF